MKNEKHMALVTESAKYYGISNSEAKAIVDKMETIIHDKLRTKADECRIPKTEQIILENAFCQQKC